MTKTRKQIIEIAIRDARRKFLDFENYKVSATQHAAGSDVVWRVVLKRPGGRGPRGPAYVIAATGKIVLRTYY